MKRKILTTVAIVMCALLLVAGSIAGTLAYLTSQATVNNTFTVGNIVITMDEAKVDEYGKVIADADRVSTSNINVYRLIPGKTYTKDTTIHVKTNSEDCYLFVKLTNGLKNITASATLEEQLVSNGWISIPSEGIYYYDTKVLRNTTADQDIAVLNSINIKGDIDNTAIKAYANVTVDIIAYAVQADGFDTALEAWEATFGASPQG